MNITDKKKLFWSVIDPIILSKGFKAYKTGMDPSYVLYENPNQAISFHFNFKQTGEILGGNIHISHYIVEDYILNIQMPNIDLSAYREKKKYHITTICQKITQKLEQYYKSLGLSYSMQCATQETEEEVIRHAHAFLHYLNHEGAAFIEHYGYLPNILKEMDRLEAEGKKWSEVLSGYGDVYFRGIIISKLCDDPNYEKKLQLVDSFFNEPDDWQPYWEKLKALLPGIEPKYPYYK